MKKYLLLLTKYNRDANSKVIKLFEHLTDEERTSDRKSFAVSLHGLLDHIAGGALYFQILIKAAYPQLSCLSHKYMDYKLDFGKINFPDFSELKEALQTLDDAYVEIANSMSEEDLNKSVELVSSYRVMNQPMAVTLLKYVNHCTHHRGQISQILDEMNVENDYSGIAEKYD